MKPLFVLLVTFAITVLTLKFIQGEYNFALSARISLSAMLVFTAAAHFVYTKGMTMMMPNFIPFKKQLVYLTGFIEILAAFGLLIPHLKVFTAWALILFFLLILPANINGAIKHIDFQKGNFEGSGLSYLWFRIPLQVVFIVWTYLSAIQF